PLYFEHNGYGYSEKWVKMSKASMKSILPRFNAQRMVMDYVQHYYLRANRHCKALAENNGAPARELARWKKKIAAAWPKVRIRRLAEAPQEIESGDILPLRVAAHLGELDAADVVMECLVGTESESGEFTLRDRFSLTAADRVGEEAVFHLDLKPTLPGLQYYKLRMYPYHKLLCNPFETGCMIWL
ncbi:MAG: DUF3417 domain-containing protein, partial [Gammaproteobacteria bacterium]|nr:DUF3417 domain-containing protein [Gammaproteobacteria bacterium]